MNFYKFTISLVLALVIVGCSRVQPIMDINDEPVAYNLTLKQVKTAIVNSAMQRGWTIKEDGKGKLSASIFVRSHFAEIEIPYDQKHYSIIYVKSNNLKAKDGNIHRNYNRWISYLNDDIKKQLMYIASKK
ncbi:hypothetical protein [Vibrio mangrovi]|uniref:Lipoprotein n=1 Tax=Vibrio mangrovi TaxID=474394 RepID=A0A1Y6ITI2_9VIBR|nr:hypothetical protein [Vibrio mangrovi]MDW6001843.1 hypothetical protein [Vibrio mangrovi]SMS00130.1 hypothetical protein VIM7927_01371 [Vibrio mangrovi]